jgi:hypothetical protein
MVLEASLAYLVSRKKNKTDKKETFSSTDSSYSADLLFLFIYLAFVLLLWGVAFYQASSCNDKTINYIIAFLFPLIFIIVRTLAPCKK